MPAIEITGSKKAKANLEKLKKDIEECTKKAAMDTAEKILELCQEYVPVDEGELKRSGVVEEVSKAILVGYNKVYAAIQHFHPEFNHPNGGRAGYLTDPVKKNERQLIQFYNERNDFYISQLRYNT
jgi:Minor capsid protein